MKKLLIITSALLLSATVALAGQAGDVTIIGDTGDSANIAEGQGNTAKQQVKSVNVEGRRSSVGDVTIVGDSGDSANIAEGEANTAKQQVQSVNVQ